MYGRMIDERAIEERYVALCDQLDERGRRLHAAAEAKEKGLPPPERVFEKVNGDDRGR